MSLTGPIILIDDDTDDQYLMKCMLEELNLPNPLRLFPDGLQAQQYLLTTSEKPLLILCDINMPVLNGLEFRDRIDADPYLKQKAIPFLFLSTSDDRKLVKKAYAGSIQGFFKKESDFETGKNNLDLMIRYWKCCLHPNN